MLRLGFEYLSSLELTDFGTPVLERLRAATGFTTHLLIRDQRDVVFVAKAQSHEPMFSSVKVHVGTRLPAHATVHGHVLMGDLTLAGLRQLYPEEKLEQFTERTPATVEELDERVRECAALGFGLSEASFERGISVVTAPVRDRSGAIVAAITATVPRSEIGSSQDEKNRLIEAVCGAALELATRLNYRPIRRRSHCRACASQRPGCGPGVNTHSLPSKRVVNTREHDHLVRRARHTRREERALRAARTMLIERVHVELRRLRQQIDVADLELRPALAVE